jgi:hypothetical protein
LVKRGAKIVLGGSMKGKQTVVYNRVFAQVPLELLRALSGSELKVVSYMLSHQEDYSPCTSEIVEKTGLTKLSVYSSIALLIKRRVIKHTESRGFGLRKQRIYGFCHPDEWDLSRMLRTKPRRASRTATPPTPVLVGELDEKVMQAAKERFAMSNEEKIAAYRARKAAKGAEGL